MTMHWLRGTPVGRTLAAGLLCLLSLGLSTRGPVGSAAGASSCHLGSPGARCAGPACPMHAAQRRPSCHPKATAARPPACPMTAAAGCSLAGSCHPRNDAVHVDREQPAELFAACAFLAPGGERRLEAIAALLPPAPGRGPETPPPRALLPA